MPIFAAFLISIAPQAKAIERWKDPIKTWLDGSYSLFCGYRKKIR